MKDETIESMRALADRLDELAATASLMGDETMAQSWRASAAEVRLHAMSHLDD